MTPALRTALERAIRKSRKKRASASTCTGCGREAALVGLTFEGHRLGFLCRFCPWESFTTKATKRRGKS